MKSVNSLNHFLTALVFSAVAASSCDSPNASNTRSSGGRSTTTCDDGTERCACYGNGTCNAGLACLSDLCVKPATAAMGGATSTAVGQGGAVALGQGGSVSTGLGGTTLVTSIGGSTNSTLAAGGSSSGGLPGVGGALSASGTSSSVGGITNTGGASAAVGGVLGASGTANIAGSPMVAGGGSLVIGGSSTVGGTAVSAGSPTIGGAATGGTAAATGGSATGGTSTGGTATGGAAPGACTASTNLISNASTTTTTYNWIGGDPTSTLDNPCGVQGAVYAYSDVGLDKTTGNADDSVQIPALDYTAYDPRTRLSPCSLDRSACCISGATSLWPVVGTTVDKTASVWGGGLGISLNDPGAGGTKRAYQGSIKGFNVTIAGTLNGQELRLAYTQSATDSCPPFMSVTAVGTYALPFVGSVACPSYTCTPACKPATATPYDIMIQVLGGDVAGAFDICITSITPIL